MYFYTLEIPEKHKIPFPVSGGGWYSYSYFEISTDYDGCMEVGLETICFFLPPPPPHTHRSMYNALDKIGVGKTQPDFLYPFSIPLLWKNDAMTKLSRTKSPSATIYLDKKDSFDINQPFIVYLSKHFIN